MADLQFHSNCCYSSESARGTAEESRPQQDRDREGGRGSSGGGEHFRGGGANSKVSEHKVRGDVSAKEKEMLEMD